MYKYISCLKSGCSPGSDGIMSEHIVNSRNSGIVLHLCNLFTVCFRYGLVPSKFTNGLLVPILKKATLDPSVAKNYRPVILSNILSKIMELFIIDECDNFKPSDYQFGFVQNRSTNTAISLAHDVASYCNYNGSSVFICSLDAEGAYDAIPHPVLFNKAINIIHDRNWKLLYNWYDNIKVQVKWNGIGNTINIYKGTRQGGLTSSMLFNIFYKDMIDELSCMNGGISICSEKFNVFCYADDILLASTTVTGLQHLISHANNYITKYGLRFNPAKTKCAIYGKNPFYVNPQWYINNYELEIVDHIEYLGAFLGKNYGITHVNKRISSCRKSFYSLQAAGLCYSGLNTDTSIHVFKTVCSSTLSYACEALSLSKSEKAELDKLQGKLVKCIVGLGPKYQRTPLLDAVRLKKMSHIINANSLSLLNNILRTDSAAKKFNILMLRKKSSCPQLLVNRVLKICNSQNINFTLLLTCKDYVNSCKRQMLGSVKNSTSGLVDSVRHMLKHKTILNRSLLGLLLKSF